MNDKEILESGKIVKEDDKDVLTYLTLEKIYMGDMVFLKNGLMILWEKDFISKGFLPTGIAIEDSKNGEVRVCHKGLLGFRDCPRPIPRSRLEKQ